MKRKSFSKPKLTRNSNIYIRKWSTVKYRTILILGLFSEYVLVNSIKMLWKFLSQNMVKTLVRSYVNKKCLYCFFILLYVLNVILQRGSGVGGKVLEQ